MAIALASLWILADLTVGALPAQASTEVVSISAGGTQTASIGTPFPTALQVTVTAGGSPSADVSVTFSAPFSGASGTFVGTVPSVTVTTNALGVATAPTFTANDTAGAYAVTAGVSGVTPVQFTLTNEPGAPVQLLFTSSPASATAGQVFATTPAVVVEDVYGNVVTGDAAQVGISLASGGGAAGAALVGGTSTAFASGVASFAGLSLDEAGTGYQLTAHDATDGLSATSSAFDVVAGAAADLTVVASAASVSPGGSTTLSGSVADAYGNPVGGATVHLATTGGTLAASQATTSAGGDWGGVGLTLPFTAGTDTVTASVYSAVYGTITKSLPLTVQPGAPYQVTIGDSPATVTVGGSTALSGTVADEYGNGVGGVSVDLSTTGGALSNAQVTTTGAGQWSGAALEAPTVPGTVTVTATVYGTISKSLPVTVSAGAPYHIALTAAQTSVVAGGGTTLSVDVADVDGNGVPGAVVDLSTTLGTLAEPQVTTDVVGQWSGIGFTAPAATGTATVTAQVYGTSVNQSLNLGVVAGTPAQVNVAASPSTVAAGGSTTLSGSVTDANGNGVGNITVDLATTGGNLATAQVTTNGSGQWSGIGLTVPTTAGQVTVTASAVGTGLSNTLALTVGPGVPSAITVTPAAVSVPAGGSTTLSVDVADGYGNAVGGATVDLAATGATLAEAQVTTATNGQWSGIGVTLPTVPGTATVTATVAGTAVSQTVSLTATALPASGVSITATPSSVAAGGAAQLAGTVTDANGNGVANATVDLAATAGSLSAPQVTTGAGGQWSGATLTLPGTAGAAGTATVTATVAGTAVSQTVTVSVAAAAPVAPDGIGTLAVSPSSLTAGATAQSLTFSYTAPDDLSGGELDIALPAGWGAGGVTAGSAPATLTGGTVRLTGLTLAAGTPLTVGLTGVTVGTTAGTASFAASEKSSAGGTLTALAASPTLTVNAPSTGGQTPGGGPGQAYTVTVALSPASVAAGGVAQVTGTVTDAAGPVAGATVALSLSRGDGALDAGQVSVADATTGASGGFDAILTAPVASGAVTLTALLTSPSSATVAGSVYGPGQTQAQAVEIVTPKGTTVDAAQELASSGACGAVVADSGYTSESGCGTGTFAVADYSGNPTGVTPLGGVGGYFDAAVSTSNHFTSVTIKECHVQSGESLDWWDPQGSGGAGAWESVFQPASYGSGCLSFVANASSSPSLSQLFGTVFTVVSGTGFPGGGGGGITPSPGVNAVSPSSGSPGTTVTVTGYGFLYATTVDFGAVPAQRYVVNSDSQLTAVVPAGGGTVDVTVSNSARTSQTGAADQFTYATAPPPAPAPPVPAKPACAPTAFKDVPSHFWAQQAIATLACQGIVGGFPDGTFRPDEPVTRAQFVKMLVLALGLKPGAGRETFSDVPPNAWYAPFVATAVGAHIVHGTSPSTFSPGATVTREQMAVLLARALRLTAATSLSFTDLARIAPWAMIGVSEAVAAGYLNGFPNGSFQPGGPTTRAQAAKVLSLVVQRGAA